MAVTTTNLGVITAYGDAVAAGYTGTKAEWQALMASYATVGQQAVDAKNDAVAAKNTAVSKATEATTAASTATTKANEASASAQSIAESAAQIQENTDSIDQLKSDLLDVEQEFDFNFPVQNLMPLSAPDITVGDVDFEYANGILTPSGTSSVDGGRLAHLIDLPNVKAGTYTISAFQTGTGNGNHLQLHLQNSSNSILASFKNNSATFTLNADADLYIGATLINNKAYNDPVGITLVTGSTGASAFIDPRKRDIVDATARNNYSKTVHIMDSNGGLTDANNADINRIYLLIDVSNVSNLPVSTSGTLITFGRTNDAIIQMYRSSASNMYIRSKWSTSWSNWKRTATIDDIPTSFETPLDVLPMFDNITCCGDSLTYSQVYTGDSTSRQAKVPYPKVLEKITGTPTTSLATAGYTAIQWWNAYHENIVEKTNQVAIIYLGTNAGLTDTIDTDASGMDVANYDKTTNTGAYCSIVKSFLDVGAKVILVKLYTSSGNKDTTNSVIKKIADKFSCGLVESAYLSDNAYHYYPDLSSYNSVHYNDIGYSAFARKLLNNIANMDKDYIKFIIPS